MLSVPRKRVKKEEKKRLWRYGGLEVRSGGSKNREESGKKGTSSYNCGIGGKEGLLNS